MGKKNNNSISLGEDSKLVNNYKFFLKKLIDLFEKYFVQLAAINL